MHRQLKSSAELLVLLSQHVRALMGPMRLDESETALAVRNPRHTYRFLPRRVVITEVVVCSRSKPFKRAEIEQRTEKAFHTALSRAARRLVQPHNLWYFPQPSKLRAPRLGKNFSTLRPRHHTSATVQDLTSFSAEPVGSANRQSDHTKASGR